MENEDKPDVVFVSNDSRQTEEEQKAVLGKGSGIIIKTAEQIMALAQMAGDRKAGFDEVAKKKMTRERALRIKELRKTESWRVIAGMCFDEWSAEGAVEEADEWYPPSNQLMGMALCEAAAALLGESSEAWDEQLQ